MKQVYRDVDLGMPQSPVIGADDANSLTEALQRNTTEIVEKANGIRVEYIRYLQEKNKALDEELASLRNEPNVRPVIRSHWKKNDNGTYSCERCHSWIPEEQRHYANWCLYCGADMRDGDDK